MKKALAREYAAFAQDMVGYLEMKLSGYRKVDKLPENHALVFTAERYLKRARMLLAATEPDTKAEPGFVKFNRSVAASLVADEISQ